jgi:hypothetical protein
LKLVFLDADFVLLLLLLLGMLEKQIQIRPVLGLSQWDIQVYAELNDLSGRRLILLKAFVCEVKFECHHHVRAHVVLEKDLDHFVCHVGVVIVKIFYAQATRSARENSPHLCLLD